MKLHKLPNGNYLELSTVTAISVKDGSVEVAAQPCNTIVFDDPAQARAYADELAILVNNEHLYAAMRSISASR